MFDIKWIRENPEKFDEGLKKRNLPSRSAELIAMDEVRRTAQTRAQQIQTERNAISKKIGIAKSKGEDTSEIIEKVSESKKEQAEAEAEHSPTPRLMMFPLVMMKRTTLKSGLGGTYQLLRSIRKNISIWVKPLG